MKNDKKSLRCGTAYQDPIAYQRAHERRDHGRERPQVERKRFCVLHFVAVRRPSCTSACDRKYDYRDDKHDCRVGRRSLVCEQYAREQHEKEYNVTCKIVSRNEE